MLRIGICDDSPEARFALQTALERRLEGMAVESAIFAFSSGEGLLGWYAKHAGELDLVFLDMEMGDLNGMETAKALRQTDPYLLLAFVTGYADFVFDGYAVGALGYLMKPVQPDKLAELLTRVLGMLRRQEDQVFLCRNGEGFYRIPRNSILYFVSDRRKVSCVTATRSYPFYGKLDEVARELGEGFVRIHQRYLVRAAAVDQVEGSTAVVGETALPISRSHHAVALAALARTLLE